MLFTGMTRYVVNTPERVFLKQIRYLDKVQVWFDQYFELEYIHR